ncbi:MULTISPECIES: hypothetical protein [unclassified Microcoleus]|nr:MULTISPECIES: hypothetical protein [unclassified Microcoleus]MCC3415219.1 hypothetical protein [Microcoleus sp. PH2017_02_FOX_O_A]MCC3519269.1 hypothetical protein [Microcoleus sp. PH2017_18_LLB_O_A]MCC3593842.1 hypothetical protein [Microcoleus sp. PH2017_28_MFU_U_A]MCC3595818.1 hypothetical protein [Microcoleus sp. PH2017_26_ELK_O_A]MCC3620621.1 hypothetical protein [Microcoleus sp. PH2017_36_ELK_O_B]
MKFTATARTATKMQGTRSNCCDVKQQVVVPIIETKYGLYELKNRLF